MPRGEPLGTAPSEAPHLAHAAPFIAWSGSDGNHPADDHRPLPCIRERLLGDSGKAVRDLRSYCLRSTGLSNGLEISTCRHGGGAHHRGPKARFPAPALQRRVHHTTGRTPIHLSAGIHVHSREADPEAGQGVRSIPARAAWGKGPSSPANTWPAHDSASVKFRVVKRR